MKKPSELEMHEDTCIITSSGQKIKVLRVPGGYLYNNVFVPKKQTCITFVKSIIKKII